MSQISPPVRILLAGAVIFLAAWFTVLRPKTESVAPTTTATPGVFNGAVSKAKGAAAAAEGAGKAAAGDSATTTGSGSATTTVKPPAVPALPAGALKGLPVKVAAGLTSQKTIVLGVIADGATRLRPLSDDDRYVRNALRRVNRYDGQVVVRTVPVGRLASYAPIVGNLQVNQTPSVVVVGGDRQARVLTGYVDRIAINQAIADARRDSIDPYVTDPYLRKLNATCDGFYTSVERWSLPTIPGKQAMVASMDRAEGIFSRYHAAVARVPAPARWRGLKAQFVNVMAARETTVRKAFRALKHNDVDGAYAAVNSFDPAAVVALDKRFDKAGVTSCSLGRRS